MRANPRVRWIPSIPITMLRLGAAAIAVAELWLGLSVSDDL